MAGLNPSSNDNLVFLHLVLKEALGDTEHIGGMGLNIVALAQGPPDQLFFDFLQGLLQGCIGGDEFIDIDLFPFS